MPGVAVVGTGFGARIHVPALRAAGFDVLALVGQNEEKTARRAGRLEIPNACTSLDQALALPGVDAVTIATPPDTHAALAIAAADAGRHVICEKPFALDAAEAGAMSDAATRAGVVALGRSRVPLGRGPRHARARGRGRRDRGAAPVLVRSRTCRSRPIPRPRCRAGGSIAARGGGWLGASGSHLVDQVRVTLGEFAAVERDAPDRLRSSARAPRTRSSCASRW